MYNHKIPLKPNQKVVCVNDKQATLRIKRGGITKGMVYTVQNCDTRCKCGDLYISLKETLPKNDAECVTCKTDVGLLYYAGRFRPINPYEQSAVKELTKVEQITEKSDMPMKMPKLKPIKQLTN